MATRGNVYALEFGWITRLNSSGIGCGQGDPDALVNNTVYPAYMIKGLISLKTAKASYAKVEFKGSGVSEGRIQAGVDTIADAELQVSQWDNALDGVIVGGSVDSTSLVNAEISAPDNINPNPNAVAFCGIAKVNKQNVLNEQVYLHFFYPNCFIRRVSPDTQHVDGTQTNPNPVTLTITPNTVQKFPNGLAFGANQGWYGYKEFEYQIKSAYPFFMDAYVQDAIAVTWNSTYLPKYSTITNGNTNNWYTRNGAIFSAGLTSHSTSTGAVVTAAAGTAAQIQNAMYQVDPSLLAA